MEKTPEFDWRYPHRPGSGGASAGRGLALNTAHRADLTLTEAGPG
jgi:hypothetical protein